MEVNSITIHGYVATKPQLKEVSGDKTLCKFRIGVNKRSQKGKKNVFFIDVTTWGLLAEKCRHDLKVGSGVLLNGSLSLSYWTDEFDQTRVHPFISASNVEYLLRCGEKS